MDKVSVKSCDDVVSIFSDQVVLISRGHLQNGFKTDLYIQRVQVPRGNMLEGNVMHVGRKMAFVMLLFLFVGQFFFSGVVASEPNPSVVFETNKGMIEIELYYTLAPATVSNFLGYVEDGFYDGTIFHRVIDNFMIQGGGFLPDMVKKNPDHSPIKNEASSARIRNSRGTISMARTSQPDSATSQFFINHVDNDALDWDKCSDGHGYCAFGDVIRGMGIVDRIAGVQTHSEKGYNDVPVDDVVIEKATIGNAEVAVEESPGFGFPLLILSVAGVALLLKLHKNKNDLLD